MTTPTFVWGTIDANGTIVSGSGDFKILKIGSGVYNINFDHHFSSIPAISGSQTRYGAQSEWPTDNVVFPFLNENSATAITGNGSAGGNQSDRSFSFIAVGFKTV